MIKKQKDKKIKSYKNNKNSKNNKNIHVADAIIGGVFGATFGWFYRREETQQMIHKIKDSELFQNIAADVYQSTEENIKAYIAMNIENQTRNLFQKDEVEEDDDDFEEEEYFEEEDLEEEDEEESYEALMEENLQLREAISRLEQRFEDLP